MEQQLTKRQIRRTVLQYRKLLSEEEYLQRNYLLLDRVRAFLDAASAKALHTFLPITKNREPDLQPLLEHLWAQGMEVIISQTDFELRQMSHYYLHAETVLIKNKLGIPEPTGALEPADISAVDLVFVPLVLADRSGHRVGYGGGYYDRLLQETNLTKVGLSLTSPVDEFRQNDAWDIPLDYLITPFKTYNYG